MRASGNSPSSLVICSKSRSISLSLSPDIRSQVAIICEVGSVMLQRGI